VVLAVVSAASGRPATVAARPGSALDQRLDHFLTVVSNRGAFAGTVLVAVGGRVVLERGYGLADRTNRRLNGPQTRFQLNSLSALVNVAALLRLVDEGKLRLDDHVCVYFGGCTSAWSALRVRALLTPPSFEPPPFPPPKGANLDAWTRRLQTQRPERWLGSEADSILIAALVERISGRSWFRAAASLLRLASLTGDGARARSYRLSAAGRPVTAAATRQLSRPSPGALALRARDLLHLFHVAEQQLSASSRQLFFGGPSEGWNCCFLRTRRFGSTALLHGGHAASNDGWYAFAARYRRRHVIIIVLSNFSGSDIAAVETTLARLVFDASYRPLRATPARTPLPASLLHTYTGLYVGARNVRVRLLAGRLLLAPSLIAISGGGADELVPTARGRFFNAREPEMRVSFTTGRAGRVTAIEIANERLGISLQLTRAAG
jgi:CubicO group peptidase (beta-lactamase class C family)